jgi:hypothetical protein
MESLLKVTSLYNKGHMYVLGKPDKNSVVFANTVKSHLSIFLPTFDIEQ